MSSHVDKYTNGDTARKEFYSEHNCETNRLSSNGYDDNNNSITTDLICAVCHAEYRNPKLLPCLHTFCKRCLEKYVECLDGDYYVKCPSCGTRRKIKSRSDDGRACLDELVSDFVALNSLDACAINVNELSDASCSNCSTRAQSRCSECALFLCANCQRAHKNNKQTKNHNVCSLALLGLKSDQILHTGDYCKTHAGQTLTHFCRTCDRAICNDCTFLDHPKDGHSVTELSDVSPTQRRQLAEILSGVRQKVPFLKRTLLDIDSVLQSLPDNADAVAREIARTTENFIQTLRQRQEELLDELTKLCAHKATVLHDQKSRIQSELEILEDNCQASEKILRNGSNSEIATVNNLVYKRLEFLRNMKLDVEADESSEFGYDSGSEKLKSEILNTGEVFLVNTSSPLKVLGDGLQDAAVGKFASFTVAKSEKCELFPGDLDIRIETPDSVLLECDVAHSGNLCNVVYNPKVPGEHEISVTFRGEHLPDSPICVNVKDGHVIYAQTKTKCTTFGHRGSVPGCLNQPCDVAVRNNGHILVADTSNHRVQIFDANGKFISNFGKQGGSFGQLTYPSGVAISPHNHVIVSDYGNHRVQVFTSGGVHLRSFGGKGSAEGLIDHPIGVAVDEEGHVVVVDQDNHRVQIFDENGKFLRQFGCYGNGNGQLDRPMYVAISPDGDIFVTDSRNHRVQIFDADGRYRESLGERGTNDGEFYYPTGITIDAAGYVVVSDQTARIQVFNAELQFVAKLEPRSVHKLECPMGIDYTPEGKIIIVDKECSNVKILYP